MKKKLFVPLLILTLLFTSCTTMLDDLLNVTISYSSDKGNVPNPKKIGVNSSLTANELPTLYQDGYTFDGWISGGGGAQICIGYVAANNLNLTAKWTVNEYKITYELNKGTPPKESNPKTYTVETPTITLNNPSRTGYGFDGWYSDKECTPANKVETIDLGSFNDIVLYAKWLEGQSDYTANFFLQNTDGETYPLISELPKEQVIKTHGITDSMPSVEDLRSLYKTPAGFTYSNCEITDIIQPDGSSVYNVYYTRDRYVISFNGNNNTEGTVPDSITKLHDVDITLPSSTSLKRKGYTYENWNTQDDGNGKAYQLGSTYTNNEPIVLSAAWSLNTYNIIYELNGGTNASDAATTYTVESPTLTLRNPSRIGYTFDGWYTTDNFSDQKVTNIPARSIDDKKYYAKWNINTYNISYELNGGSFNSEAEESYNYETPTINLKHPSKVGYDFGYWYTTPDFEEGTRQDSIPHNSLNDQVFYAKWIPIGVNIKVEYYLQEEDGTNYPNTASTIISNQKAVSDSIPEIDTLVGYYTKPGFTYSHCDPITAVKPDGTSLYKLYYTRDRYDINFYGNNNTSGTLPEKHVKLYNVDLPIPSNGDLERKGYTFDRWNVNSDGTAKNYKVGNFTENIPLDLYAKWNLNTYNIKYELNGGTNGDNPPTYTVESDTITLKDPSKTGYIFLGWYPSNNTIGTKVTEVSHGSINDKTFYAQWKPITYSITYNLNNGKYNDSITIPTRSNLKYDQVYNLPTSSNINRVGYRFDGWSVTGDGVTPNKTSIQKEESTYINLTSKNGTQLTFTAKWNPIPVNYTVNFFLQDTDGEHYSSAIKTYKNQAKTETVFTEDELKALYETPTGFTYSHNDGLNQVKPNGTSVYNFYYTRDRYTISFDGNNNTSGNLPASLTKLHDVTQTIPGNGNLLRTGYKFGGWTISKDGAVINYEANASFTDNKSITLYAKWIPVPVNYTVNFFFQNADNNEYPTKATKSVNKKVESETQLNLEDIKKYHTTTGYTYSKNDGLAPVSPNGDSIYNLYYTRNKYSIEFIGNGSKSGSMSNQEFKYDVQQKLNPNSFERTGYKFVGWKTEQSSGTSYNDKNDIENLTSENNKVISLYAQWEPIDVTYTVKFFLQDEDGIKYTSASVQTSTGKAKSDSSITLEKLKSYYTIPEGYSYDKSSTIHTIKPDGKGVYNLYYKRNQYDITFDGNGNNTGSEPTSIKKIHGVAKEIPSNTGNLGKTGYLFKGWNTKADGKGTNYTDNRFEIENPTTLYAKWEPITYDVSYNLNGGNYNGSSNVTEGDTKVKYNANGNLPDFNKLKQDGYSFEGWKVSIDGKETSTVLQKDATTFINLTDKDQANVTLTAQWKLSYFDVKFESISGVTYAKTENFQVIAGNNILEYLNKQGITAKKEPGYSFDHWEYNGVKLDAQTMPASTITLKPIFREHTYTVTFDGSSPKTVNYTESFIIPNGPNKEGYTFHNWTINGKTYNASQSVSSLTANDGVTLVASANLSANIPNKPTVNLPSSYNGIPNYNGFTIIGDTTSISFVKQNFANVKYCLATTKATSISQLTSTGNSVNYGEMQGECYLSYAAVHKGDNSKVSGITSVPIIIINTSMQGEYHTIATNKQGSEFDIHLLRGLFNYSSTDDINYAGKLDTTINRSGEGNSDPDHGYVGNMFMKMKYLIEKNIFINSTDAFIYSDSSAIESLPKGNWYRIIKFGQIVKFYDMTGNFKLGLKYSPNN